MLMNSIFIIPENTKIFYYRLDDMDEDDGNCLDGLKIDAGSKLVLSEEIRQFQCENSIPPSLLESL